jgi:hypothetical protein
MSTLERKAQIHGEITKGRHIIGSDLCTNEYELNAKAMQTMNNLKITLGTSPCHKLLIRTSA